MAVMREGSVDSTWEMADEMKEQNYEIYRHGVTVEATAVALIPFEPKGWRRDFRDELAAELRSLTGNTDEILRATYSGPAPAGSDVENLLIYNVGPGSLRSATQQGLRFERLGHQDALHRYRYTMEPRVRAFPPIDPMLAFAHAESLLSDRSLTSCAGVWAAVCSGTRSILRDHNEGNRFSVSVRLVTPRPLAGSTICKPLLDGLIAAFHSHDGTDEPLILERLQPPGYEPTASHRFLRDGTHAVLGERCLVRPFGAGLKWNPGDDLCAAVEILLDHEEDATPRLEATLYSRV